MQTLIEVVIALEGAVGCLFLGYLARDVWKRHPQRRQSKAIVNLVHPPFKKAD